MPKRFRTPQAKDNQLLAKLGSVEGELDLYYCHPGNKTSMRADSRCLMHALEEVEIYDGKNLRQLLTERGYDITTLKFSIMKKTILPEPPKE